MGKYARTFEYLEGRLSSIQLSSPSSSDAGLLARDEVQANRRAYLTGANLDEVAELVGEPEATPALLGDAGTEPPDQWLLDPAAVLDLDQQSASLPPEPQHASAATVHDAVGGELAGGGDEIVNLDRTHAHSLSRGRDAMADPREPGEAEGDRFRLS